MLPQQSYLAIIKGASLYILPADIFHTISLLQTFINIHKHKAGATQHSYTKRQAFSIMSQSSMLLISQSKFKIRLLRPTSFQNIEGRGTWSSKCKLISCSQHKPKHTWNLLLHSKLPLSWFLEAYTHRASLCMCAQAENHSSDSFTRSKQIESYTLAYTANRISAIH